MNLKKSATHSIYIVFVFFLLFSGNIFIFKQYQEDRLPYLIQSDAQGYYEYLPYFFIKQDIKHITYAYTLENGNTIDKYPCGVALLQTPFFLGARVIAQRKHWENDIYGIHYIMSIAVSASFYMAFGLIIFFYYLRKYFKKITALITVLLVYGTTNLFYYSMGDPGMSHVYSFFCVCCFLFFIDRLFQNPSAANIILTAVFLGLATEVRPTNFFIATLYLLYGIHSIADMKNRFRFFQKNWKFFPISFITVLIVIFPQLLYWHTVTGDWVVFSYKYNHESFVYWKQPKIGEVLFGLVTGWITYTPVMIFLFVGLLVQWRKQVVHAWAVTTVFILILYACASWWMYTFICAFGYRSFVEYYPLFFLPIAGLIEKMIMPTHRIRVALLAFLCIFFVYVNIRMTYDYQHWYSCNNDSWTWEAYWKAIGNIVFFQVN